MTVKWIEGGDYSNQVGKKLLYEFTHSANTELIPSSVDWALGSITFSNAHGLVSKKTTLVCPRYKGFDVVLKDILSIPTEWNNASYRLALVPIDSYSCYVVRENDATDTPLTVNTISTENNGNLDISLFQFELLVAWDIVGLEPVKILEVKSTGYVQMNRYRYARIRYIGEDGNQYLHGGVIPLYNAPMPNNGTRTVCFAGLFFIIDTTPKQKSILLTFDGRTKGRRIGYNTMVLDGGTEGTYNKEFDTVSANQIAGVNGLQGSASDAYHANGSLIQFFDLGGS